LPRDPAAVIRGIIFDLDGTLIDSLRDIATAVNRMRAERQLEPLSVDEVGVMVGEGARMLVRRALPAGTSKEDARSALGRYLEHYIDVCLQTTVVYKGVAAMLASLAPSYSLGVLTNKGENLSRHILAGLGLDRHLREVVGGDTLPTRKPNPGGLYLLADRMAIAAHDLLLVGDSDVDARTAHAAGSYFALAEWGARPLHKMGEAPSAPPADDGGTALGASAVLDDTMASTALEADLPPPTWHLRRPSELAAILGLTQDPEDS
jgi:2-phosphoglycolate phosphatase